MMRPTTFPLVLALGQLFAGSVQASPPSASPFIYSVTAPRGADDTDRIQTALNACVAHGPGCTVQLANGTYHTRQLVAYNFRGTFKGKGTDRTTIEAISNLTVNVADVATNGECRPNTTSCLWPSLIIFVDGDIHISDLSIKITATDGTTTTPWPLFGKPYTILVDAVRVMGEHRTNASIERVAMAGLPDNSSNGFGFNVINGILYAGELPRSATPFDYYFLSGRLIVRNSSFRGMVDGVGTDGFFRDSDVIIGGDRASANTFEDVSAGIWTESAQNSRFDVSYNRSSGKVHAMRVDPWLPNFVPGTPSQYLIHDNHFDTVGEFAEVLHLENAADNPWIRAVVYDNTITSNQTMLAGIAAYNTRLMTIFGNKVSGTAVTGIGLVGGTLDNVIGNDLRHLKVVPDFGLAHIYLDPDTQHDLVVCTRFTDTVLNQGADNRVIGCREQQP